MKRIIHILVWLSLGSVGLPEARAEKEASYEAAMNDYRANRIRDAVRTLRILLAKDVRNKEAAMMLGTIYFQNHRSTRAYYYFEKGDPSLLNDDTAFAWGATYLEANEDKKAALGFRYLIKNKGPFRPLAVYHLAVIAYKAGQWSRARKYFQKVSPRDLPPILRVSRRRYLSSIKRQQDKMLKAIVSGVDRAGQDLADVEPQSPRRDKSDGDADMKSNAQPYRPDEPAAWQHGVRPSIAAMQQSRVSDNHGLSHNSINVTGHREGIGGISSYRDRSGFSSDIAYNLGIIAYSSETEWEQYFSLDQVSGVFASQKGAIENERNAFVALQPRFSLYLSDNFRLEFDVNLVSYFPNIKTKETWGLRSFQLNARHEDGNTELGLALSLQQPFDDYQHVAAQDLAGEAELEQQFGDLRLNLQAYAWRTNRPEFVSPKRFRVLMADPLLRYRIGFASEAGASGTALYNTFADIVLQLRYESVQRAAPSGVQVNRLHSTDMVEPAAYGSQKGLTSASIPLGDTATIIASAAYHMLSGFHSSDYDVNGVLTEQYVSDAEQVIYQGAGIISFAEWIRLHATYTLTGNFYGMKSSDNRGFRSRNPDYVVESDFYLELAKTF